MFERKKLSSHTDSATVKLSKNDLSKTKYGPHRLISLTTTIIKYNLCMNFTRLLEICSTANAQTHIRVRLSNAFTQAPQAFEAYEQSLEKLDAPTWGWQITPGVK